MSSMAKVAISTDFFNAFAALPRQTQGKVTEFLTKFRNNPRSPSIHYEKLSGISDKKICSVRIDDTYRGIVAQQEDTGIYLLLWVDHHDEAYAWASRKRCEVNPETGSVQVFDIQMTEEAPPTQKGIFADVSDRILMKLGLPDVLVPYVKNVPTAEKFFSLKEKLPADAYEYLSYLAEGFSADDVLALAETERQKEPVSDNDFEAALQNPETLKSFVVVEGEEELRRMLAEPLEKWRVFLHPTQRKIVSRDFTGPARVLGGAGTGKTVVAMHRAKYLASKVSGKEKILFTTFTTNLASDIQANLKKICTITELRSIEVINLDAWVSQFLKERGFNAKVIYGDDVVKLWESAVTLAGSDFLDASFYQDEWNRIVLAQEAMSLEAYVKAKRNGRGTRLDRKMRIQVWGVFEAYQRLMKEKQVRDANTAMYECRLILENSNTKPLYSGIIVDEGQDLSDNAYRLLRTLAGEEHPNDLFIVGDTHQRIYKNHAVLSKCGINIRGRSSVLRINYRTTEETRKFAFALLQGLSFDDMDEEVDSGDKCRSLMHGEKPHVRFFPNAEDELSYLLSEINRLKETGVSPGNICVVARTNSILDDYIEKFTANGIRAYKIKTNKADDRNYEGLRFATMHRVKGLEFRYVFIVSVNHRIVPLYSAIDRSDPVTKAETLTAERCLLYVALTRAQKEATITSFGKKSEFLMD